VAPYVLLQRQSVILGQSIADTFTHHLMAALRAVPRAGFKNLNRTIGGVSA